ncbi:unnamed protein product [Paramecium primaurelia]|uniref:Uncharacterized protein n=1 Tax=Paramecium primaurelia TaxID=5886 RepID=A0A8S1NE83_PARPR|nr:unnamed protein product [Paramecium primaurelia]
MIRIYIKVQYNSVLIKEQKIRRIYQKNQLIFLFYLIRQEKLSPKQTDPNLVKIFGKQNADREYITNPAHKPQYIKLKMRKNSDEKVLKQIDNEFQKQVALKQKLKIFDSDQMNQIRNSLHDQIVHSNRESFSQIIDHKFSTNLTPEHCQIIKTLRQELTFKEKLKLKEPIEFAKSVLTERIQRQLIYKKQVQHDQKFFKEQNHKISVLNLEKLNVKSHDGLDISRRSISHKDFVKSINDLCLTERQTYRKMLKKFNFVQRKFCNKYNGILDEVQTYL